LVLDTYAKSILKVNFRKGLRSLV